MAIFNSYVSHYQRVFVIKCPCYQVSHDLPTIFHAICYDYDENEGTPIPPGAIFSMAPELSMLSLLSVSDQ